jgi:predicted PhzF superfamily epimerase YddE/YHI9
VRIFVVDAFTDRAFSGNPAGVVLLDAPAEPGWMQCVAAEMRHAETAFVVVGDDRGELGLRWFTPAVEVDLCGHATLASAAALSHIGRRGPFRFATRSGTLTAQPTDSGFALDFPAKPVTPRPAPVGLTEALQVKALGVHGNGMDLLVEVADAATVRGLQPDIAALAEVECRGVIVTAAADTDADHDFVSRFFAPRVGVDEDPVTGSAHCALAPFWAQRLGCDRLTGVQLSPRGGRVNVQIAGERVGLNGSAVVVLAGDLLV